MTLDEVRTMFLGKRSPPEVLEVEKGAAKRFAVAVGDLNPHYLDEDFARLTIYGSIVSPPGFFGWPVKQPAPMFSDLLHDLIEALKQAGFPDLLDGECEFDFALPVRAGDILVCDRTITDIFSRRGGSGRPLAFYSVTSRFTNQNGKLVATLRQTSVALPANV